jgi:predicted nucleotidyltransferase component of viral defense system
MKPEIQQMLGAYHAVSPSESRNALKEIIQEIVLQALSQTDFFSHAAFYGGTALRIFHDLDRFSEDMDFSLLTENSNFSISDYLSAIERTLNSYGFKMSASVKKKQGFSPVQSAFLKDNTLLHVVIWTEIDPPISGISRNELIKIKLEIDTTPPPGALYEQKFNLLPQPYSVQLYDMPSLFAGKVHALICRNWKQRVKGRDFYDYVWYLTQGTPLNLIHLEARMKQTGPLLEHDTLTIRSLKDFLQKRFELIDFERAKLDVSAFIKHREKLDIWSKEFFTSITQDYLIVE